MNATHERNPLDPQDMMSLRHWEDPTGDPDLEAADNDSMVDCGWGRLIFGQTFSDPHTLADAICHEQPGKRDIALYLRDPQVVVSLAPQDLFIDPSYTYRLALSRAPGPADDAGWNIRRARAQDAEAIRRIYQTRRMVAPPKSFFATVEDRDEIDVLVAEDGSGIIGVVTGIDHVRAFNDPDGGASLWALAADTQSCQ